MIFGDVWTTSFNIQKLLQSAARPAPQGFGAEAHEEADSFRWERFGKPVTCHTLSQEYGLMRM